MRAMQPNVHWDSEYASTGHLDGAIGGPALKVTVAGGPQWRFH
jgi:hypothetical protein